jgi:hypothetical protein
LYFFRIDSAGKCHAVALIGWNSDEAAEHLKCGGAAPAPTRRSVFASPGPMGLGVKVDGDSVVVEHYNNAEGKHYVEWFAYDGEHLHLTRSCTGIPTECEDVVQPQ